jgi:hypothetical protein
MRSITPIWVLVLITFACFPAIAIAQQEPPPGQSTITGRVIYADTGRPVRRATVKLYTDMKRRPRRATAANVRGEFQFTDVVAGSYFVVAEAPGLLYPRSSYTINEFGIGSDTEVDHTRVAVDGKNSARCEIRVTRAGSISGTITYADKEPVLNGGIVLFRRKNGVVVPFFSEAPATNDRGMYRVDGLPDGEYFLGVVTGMRTAVKISHMDDKGIPTAYYPGVVDLAEAKPIQIQSGSEVEGISITLDDEPLRMISGVIKWRKNGKGVPGAALSLRRKNEPKVDLSMSTMIQATSQEDNEDGSFFRDFGLITKSFPPLAEADPQGQWAFPDLPPGTYEVTAFASPPRKDKTPKTDAQEPEDESSAREIDPKRVVFRKIEVTIADEDRKDVTIELTEANTILGTVVAEGSEPAVVAIMMDQRGGSEILMSVPRPSNPDGTFVIEGVPTGEVILDADVSRSRDLYLKSITLGSQDLMREPLVVSEGAEVTGVRIAVGQGLATLTGRVQLKEDGSPAAGGGVLLMKSDPKLWHLRSSRIVAMANAAGEFKLRCAPGDYLVFAWPAGAQPLQSIEDFVRAQAATARTITLQSKEEKQIDLTVVRQRK